MAIPESQLQTWSHQGSMTQSSATYNTIKNVLEQAGTAYSGRDYSVFLQGSYGNDTNIYSESDVDIVIQLNSCFWHDLERLPAEQKAAFQQAHSNADYGYADFKKEVLAHLQATYGATAKPGDKAIKIDAGGGRRKADVLVTTQFRRYHRFLTLNDEQHEKGICFLRTDGTRIPNYPKQHLANCTTKHQATSSNFKPMVRIMKNLRRKLVEDGLIGADVAPSYYIEGLLHNVPDAMFGCNYSDSFVKSVNWILEADRSKFLCANQQYFLLHDTSPFTWRASNCTTFLNAACELWKNW